MSPYRIDLRCPPGGAADRLIDLGALDVETGVDEVAAIMPDDVRPETIVDDLRPASARVSPARGRDDGSVWVLTPRPVRIRRTVVVPASSPPDVAGVRLIDSDTFGSGLHPTTALCLAALDEEVEHGLPARLLDVGTGSGVLALAALRLGVPHVTAIDIDASAMTAAAENARINGVSSSQLELVHGGPERLAGAWPLVVANVLAAPLLEMAPQIVARVGGRGRLVLSGIAASLADEVERGYRRLGMRPAGRESRAGWVVLTLSASW